MPERNTAIVKAYATGRYSQKQIAQAFDIHYATVSRIVKANKTDAADHDEKNDDDRCCFARPDPVSPLVSQGKAYFRLAARLAGNLAQC